MPNFPLTLNYVVDKTTPELEDPLLKTDVKKQLSKAAIRVNNERNFLKKKTYNAYVVQVFTPTPTSPAVHGTTIANIFQKIANTFSTNNTQDAAIQCRAIVPDLHDSVIPIPEIVEESQIVTNGEYHKFLNMIPIFYAPAGEILNLGIGSIIEVQFNDNNYNEGRIVRVIKSTVVNPVPAPSFPTPFVPSSGPQPQIGTPLPLSPAGTNQRSQRGGVKLGTGPCTAPDVKNSKDPSFNCCPPSSYPTIPTAPTTSTKGITIQQRVESMKRVGEQNGYPRWLQVQAMAISLQEQPNQGPNFNMAGIQLDVGAWPSSAMAYVSVQTCIRDSQKWRIFAGFNSLDDFSNFMLIVTANKYNKNRMSDLSNLTPGTSQFTEGVLDNWVRGWNLSLSPQELLQLKTQGYVVKGSSTVTKDVGKYRSSFTGNINKILPYFK